MIAARVALDPEPRVLDRTALFEGYFHQYRWHRQYDVLPDGDRFLLISVPPTEGHVTFVRNWVVELGATDSK